MDKILTEVARDVRNQTLKQVRDALSEKRESLTLGSMAVGDSATQVAAISVAAEISEWFEKGGKFEVADG